MNATFLVRSTQDLPNGRTIATGIVENGELSIGMIGHTSTTNLKVEILSVAIVDPTPSDQRAKMISLRILNGIAENLENSEIIFADQK